MWLSVRWLEGEETPRGSTFKKPLLLLLYHHVYNLDLRYGTRVISLLVVRISVKHIDFPDQYQYLGQSHFILR